MAGRPRSRWIIPLVMVAIIAGIWWLRRKPPADAPAYIGDRAAILWSTTAQVRQPVTTLHYGDKVSILRRAGDQAEVRSEHGLTGWLDARLLMQPELWQQSTELLKQVRTMPVQAAGHTRARSNVRIGPGRDAPAIFQFGPNEPLAVFNRKVVTVSRPVASAPDDKDSAAPDTPVAKDRDEDWLLVLRAQAPSGSGAGSSGGVSAASATAPDVSGPIAGWVLGQFVALDPPGPIGDYTSAAGMRAVAWVVLNTVPDASGDKPQYLVAAARGGQDRACDFTGLRVYTWGTQRQRYETAYVENNICGELPIRVRPAPGGAEFRFPEVDERGAERVYRMNQTVVRRVRDGGAVAPKRR